MLLLLLLVACGGHLREGANPSAGNEGRATTEIWTVHCWQLPPPLRSHAYPAGVPSSQVDACGQVPPLVEDMVAKVAVVLLPPLVSPAYSAGDYSAWRAVQRLVPPPELVGE